MKRQFINWEKISASDVINKGLISKMYEQPTQLSNENPIKMDRRPKQTFSHVYRHMKRCSISLIVLEKCKSKL